MQQSRMRPLATFLATLILFYGGLSPQIIASDSYINQYQGSRLYSWDGKYLSQYQGKRLYEWDGHYLSTYQGGRRFEWDGQYLSKYQGPRLLELSGKQMMGGKVQTKYLPAIHLT
jgi:hypothetical protein